jgi:hypothetical protein
VGLFVRALAASLALAFSTSSFAMTSYWIWQCPDADSVGGESIVNTGHRMAGDCPSGDGEGWVQVSFPDPEDTQPWWAAEIPGDQVADLFTEEFLFGAVLFVLVQVGRAIRGR